MAKSFDNNEGSNESDATPSCEDMIDDQKISFESPTCEEKADGTIVIKRHISAERSNVKIERALFSAKYEIDVTKAIELLTPLEEIDASASPANSAESMAMLKMMGAKFNYHLTLPGTIVDPPVGIGDGSTVTFDLLDLERPPLVTSKSLNTLPLFIGGGLAFFLLVILVLVLGHKQHPAGGDVAQLAVGASSAIAPH